MAFVNGKTYSVRELKKTHRKFDYVQRSINKKNRSKKPIILLKLWETRWIDKPFSFSYTKFNKEARWFWHGSSNKTIQNILNSGFKVGGSSTSAANGSMLGKGVYAAYHSNKVLQYAVNGCILSVRVYAPKTLTIHPGKLLTKSEHENAKQNQHAIEVRSGAKVHNKWGGTPMAHHEICVYNPIRVVPYFICKIK